MVEQNLFFLIDSWDVLSIKQAFLYDYGSVPSKGKNCGPF